MLRLLLINLTVLLVWLPYLRNGLLNLLGFDLSRQAKVGLSVFFCSKVVLAAGAQIGAFNLVKCSSVTLGEDCRIGHMNIFKGLFHIRLQHNSHIGNFNLFKNNGLKTIPAVSTFFVGKDANITSSHYVDLSCNVTLGENSVIGGRSSTLWTHGFVHFNKGADRPIKLADILIKEGVYIGSNCVLNPGVIIESDINIGAGSSVAGHLTKPGLYVNTALRHIELQDLESFLAQKTHDKHYKTGNIRIF
ncbi:hypothetical protein CBF23_014585 [Marinomonas agarivorans]|nr:hypothetical protein CBF23_014585 [Marinomonas agarivorans]